MDETELGDVQSEVRFIGSLFINSDLFLEYEKVVRWDYYFIDPICKELYKWLEILYSREQKFNEKNIVAYAMENEERLNFFKSFGGYKTIKDFMDISDESELKAYFSSIQKWALIRELEAKGINTQKIRESNGFEKANSNQIYNKIKRIVDGVHTKVTADVEVVSMVFGLEDMANGFLEKPDMGTLTFMESFNQSFRGWREGTMFAFGTPTNGGKSRFMTKIAAYHAIIQKQKTLLMLNEMRDYEIKLALLVTCINNDEFKVVHGIDTNINEKELSLGLYKNSDGQYIYRKTDKEGNHSETLAEYKNRLLRDSKQYREVMLVSKWVEENVKDDILSVIDVASDYSDSTLETIARKNARKGYKMICFDNLKSNKESIGDYSGLIKTTTILSEVAKTENVFMYASIQQTPDTLRMDDLELSSMNIASAKGLKDVLDMLVLTKEIDKERYGKYRYIPTSQKEGFGEMSKMPLPLVDKGHEWKKYVFQIDKNRAGSKEALLVDVNLNRNIWNELGVLIRA